MTGIDNNSAKYRFVEATNKNMEDYPTLDANELVKKRKRWCSVVMSIRFNLLISPQKQPGLLDLFIHLFG